MTITATDNTQGRRNSARDAAASSHAITQYRPGPRAAPFRLAIVAQHVVQYHAPLYRQLAASDQLDVHVYYLDRAGAEAVYDPTMGADIKWDIDLLSGYDHEFVPNWSPAKTRYGFLQRVNPALYSRLRREKWDAVLVQGYQPLSNWLAMLAAKMGGSKVIFRGETTLRETSGVKHWIKRHIFRCVFGLSDAVMYSCTGNRKCFQHFGCPDEKLHLIPCAVDNEFFRRDRGSHLEAAARLRESWGFPRDVPIILSVARLDENKNQSDLLEAAWRLQESGMTVGVVLVGEGVTRASLQRQVEQRGLRYVQFAGFVNQTGICQYYAAADIFALCSKFVEQSPKVVNEALNFSLPLVCSDVAGTVGDVIVHGDNAFTYSPGDVETLTANLRELIVNPDSRRKMGQRSLDLADQWSLEANVRAVEDVLHELYPNRLQERDDKQPPV